VLQPRRHGLSLRVRVDLKVRSFSSQRPVTGEEFFPERYPVTVPSPTSSPVGAVFLSYAHEDAAAARRLAAALQAAGIEVWFDESELRGGDAWDAKIRQQVRECALFVPIISAATQARREGYFRIEWKLAAQRTHAIAEGTPFLLPAVLDGITENAALVPAEFREIQWTPLSGDAAIEPFCARVRDLASGLRRETGARRAGEPGAAGMPVAHRSGHFSLVRAAIGLLAVGVVIGLGGVWWQRRSAAAANTLAKSVSRTAALAQRRTIEGRDQLDTVVERARREAEASPGAAAWSKCARLEAQYVVRGWDVSDQRRQEIQTQAKRALDLDPGSVDAMFALAVVFLHQGAFAEAEALMRKAMVREPTDAELRQALGTALSGEGRDAEALALRRETLRLFPSNPFAHYDLALSFEKASPPDLGAALRKFDDSLALQPVPSTILHKASLVAGWQGDVSAAQQILDRMDPLDRTGDRAVGIAMILALLQHQPDRAIKAAGLTARTYLDDDYVRGPKAWLLAHAHSQAGKTSLALAQWRDAEVVLKQRLQATAENWSDQAGLAITLAWQDKQQEAAAMIVPLEAVAQETNQPLQQLYLAYYYAGCGDASKTAKYLERVLEKRELVTARTLPLDPWWEKVRTAPAFVALLANPASRGGQK
jgi:Flp pilus assembly protein TadD